MNKDDITVLPISHKSKSLIEMRYYSDNSKDISNAHEFDIYVVKPNDTIESVAALFNMTPSKLRHINKLSLRTLLIDQKLKVLRNTQVNCTEENEINKTDEIKPTLCELENPLDQLSISLNCETELFPIHYSNNFIKVNVKYITDTEGVIKGKLILTPVALTFNPAFQDPVVQEYGIDQFTIHLPNNKIACVSMYNDSSVMAYKRSQRMICSQIISPCQQQIKFSCKHSDDNNHNLHDFETINNRKLNSIVEDEQSENKPSEIIQNDESQNKVKKPIENNYLCVIASPRYRKTKVIFQKEDEYWFVVPASSTDQVLNYLSGTTEYDAGANVDSQNKWLDEKNTSQVNSSSSSTQKKLSRSSSFSKVNKSGEHIHSSDTFGLIRELSIDWEIINNDFDLLSCQNMFYEDYQFSESQILIRDQMRTLMEHVPVEAIGAKWDLIYGTHRDGWSLQTLYRKVFDSTRNPCILIVKDMESNVFGAMCNTYIRMSRSFYGNGLTFLFRWNPKFEKFKCIQKNSYIMLGDPKYFVIGSDNSKHAIRINSTLYNGITQKCQTFGSPPLVKSEIFQILSLEVWSFY